MTTKWNVISRSVFIDKNSTKKVSQVSLYGNLGQWGARKKASVFV